MASRGLPACVCVRRVGGTAHVHGAHTRASLLDRRAAAAGHNHPPTCGHKLALCLGEAPRVFEEHGKVEVHVSQLVRRRQLRQLEGMAEGARLHACCASATGGACASLPWRGATTSGSSPLPNSTNTHTHAPDRHTSTAWSTTPSPMLRRRSSAAASSSARLVAHAYATWVPSRHRRTRHR
jgi:hypothetical protein